MNEAIFGLAYLQYMHEVLHKDIIDCYVPLFCKCILQDGCNVIDSQKIKSLMSAQYGITNLTFGAIDTILNRMASTSYSILSKNNGQFFVNESKLAEYEVTLNKNDSIREDFNTLINNISEYSKKFEKAYSKEEVEDGLFHFLDLHGIDLLNGEGTKVYDRILQYQDKRLSYVISRYVVDNNKEGGNAIDILNRLAKGNAITQLISLKGLSKYSGRLDNVTIYIDTPFFYNLLGANNNANRESSEEIMSILERNGAHFAIFNHNLNEVLNCFEDAITRLRTSTYDLHKSSRLLRMAVAENFSALQLDSMRANIDSIKSQWNIAVQDPPESRKGYTEIDATLLTEIISEAYTNKRTRQIFGHEMSMIANDVDSISFIHRIRGNELAQNLKGCKAILLTTNHVIAAASNDNRISTLHHPIPACVTDVFLSTIIWTNNPNENDSLNRKLLLCECYNNIQLNDDIMARFYDDIKTKKLTSDISESQYLKLTTSTLALRILGDKTQNDINAYTDRTPNEILQILEQEHKNEVENALKQGEERLEKERAKNEAELNKQQEQHNKELAEKDTTIKGLSETVDNIDQKCKSIAQLVSLSISVLLFITLTTLLLLNLFSSWGLFQKYSAKWWWYLIGLIPLIWSFGNMWGLPIKFLDLKNYIYRKSYTKLYSYFTGKED